MNVIVFGASGKTGSLVVRKALAAGHAITVFAHEQGTHQDGVRQITGDARDPAAVERALAGQDAAIDTIGGRTPYRATDLETAAARNIVEGMRKQRSSRLIVISAMGVGDSAEQAPFWYEHLLMPTFMRGTAKDKAGMEGEVRSSGLAFVIARPPMLSDDPETGSVRIITGEAKGHRITRGDLAQFLVDQLRSDEHLGRAVVVANR